MKKEDNTFKFERVLLIDDNDIDNFINERMITTTNFGKSVVVKTSSEQALQYLKKSIETQDQLPQVIFLDLNMPVVDGFGFLAEYENLSDTLKKSCKVIVLSSSISPDDINRASTNAYVSKYINKPLNEKYLDAIQS